MNVATTTPTSSLPYKLYWSNAKRQWLGKWQDAESLAWKMKVVPPDFTHEQDATEWFAQWWSGQRINVASPEPVVRMTVTLLGEWWVNYLQHKPGAEPRIAEDADRLVRLWIRPSPLGVIQLNCLQLQHCVDWVEGLQRADRADYTVRNIVQAMRTLFSDARGKGRHSGENFFNDPFLKGMLKGAETVAGNDVVIHLRLDEVQKAIAYKGSFTPIRRHARNITAMLTGLRAGELAALRWCDVDLKAEVPSIKVHRQLTRPQKGATEPKFKPPKRKSKRTIPLHPHVVEVLKKWRDAWGEWCGVELTDESPIFAGVAGEYVNDFHAHNLWLDLAAYGTSPLFEQMHPFHPHALRRTCLTLLTNAGVQDGDIKEIAGHAKAGVTRKHYVGDDLARLHRAVMRMLPGEDEKKS